PGSPSAGVTTYSYNDGYQLFLSTTYNELPHQFNYTRDLGTGLLTSEFGPGYQYYNNFTAYMWDTKIFTYDGLGRLTKEQVVREPPGPEDGIHGYVYNTPRTLTYDNFPANAVTEKRAIKWGALDDPPDASQQTSVYKVYDGLNRLRDTFVSTPASLPQEHHIITYDNRDNIASVSDPD